MYTINFGNGIIDEGYDDLDAAKAAADKMASYTQQPIIIEDDDIEISRREWYGVKYQDGDAEDPILFGDFGFYADWVDSVACNRRAAAMLLGSAKSEAKVRAARENGRKGGRPRRES